MAQPNKWTSENTILVTTAALATVIPKGDLKDYLQNIVGRNTEVTLSLKDTKKGKERIVQFDSENGTFTISLVFFVERRSVMHDKVLTCLTVFDRNVES